MKQNRHIAFRTDASLEIGTGHVMRCLTLADALTVTGTKCSFICRAHDGHLAALIRQRGYLLYLLDVAPCIPEQDAPLAHATWLGASMAQDAAETSSLLSRLQPDWLIVDHYALDARWETPQRRHAARLMVIDDLADRLHDCDLLLDQNLGRLDADYAPLVPAHCQRLLGPAYALLRPEFAALRDYSLQRRQVGTLRSMLISMGGVDKDNATGHILQTLSGVPLPKDFRITVVMGATAPWLNQVKVQAATLRWSVDVHVNVINMAQLMADADLAIGAAGSTSWERCCLGIPSILLVLAENQQYVANQLAAADAALVIDGRESLEAPLLAALEQLLSRKTPGAKISEKAAALIDGQGTQRISAILVCAHE